MPQRFSQQRERIYQTVLESRAHPTAEMVYQQLKPEMPRLSLGTVYRNLQQMAREGRLTELDGPVTRFDAALFSGAGEGAAASWTGGGVSRASRCS